MGAPVELILYAEPGGELGARCAEFWAAMSSADALYVDNAEFRAMVEMGWDAVPYMIEKLRSDEDAHFLIHALASITGERPAARTGGNEAGGRPEVAGNQTVAEAWVAWWEARAARQDHNSHSDEGGS